MCRRHCSPAPTRSLNKSRGSGMTAFGTGHRVDPPACLKIRRSGQNSDPTARAILSLLAVRHLP